MILNTDIIPTVADTTAPLAHFAKNGYYLVGNKIFNHKILALQEATRSRLPITWNFNDEVYNQVNWQTRDNISLTELYRIRAQQLRNQYDYLVLCWSAGADSDTILNSFLDNNILLDEIVLLWPISKTQGKYIPKVDNDPYNMVSEWDLTIKPRIEYLKKHHPNLKITICDILDDVPPEEFSDDTVLILEKHNYFSIQKYRALDNVLRDRAEQYPNTATIVGVAPVETVILDDYLAIQFIDSVATATPKSDYTLQGWARNIEFFYWTPSLPELIKEQAHVVLDHVNRYPASKQYLGKLRLGQNKVLKKVNVIDRELYRQFRKALLYPNYNLSTFQAIKSPEAYDQMESAFWFNDDPQAEQFLAPWRSAIASHRNLIDPMFFQKTGNRITGYRSFESKFHIIGKLIDVQN